MGAPVLYGFPPGGYGMPQVGQPMGMFPPGAGAGAGAGPQQLPSPSTGAMVQGFPSASQNRQQIQPGVRGPHQQPQPQQLQLQGQRQGQSPNNRRRQHPYNNMGGGGMFPYGQVMPQPMQMQMSAEGGLIVEGQEIPGVNPALLESNAQGQHRKNADHKTKAGKKNGDVRRTDSDNNRGDKKGKQRDTTHYSLENDFPALVKLSMLSYNIFRT